MKVSGLFGWADHDDDDDGAVVAHEVGRNHYSRASKRWLSAFDCLTKDGGCGRDKELFKVLPPNFSEKMMRNK